MTCQKATSYHNNELKQKCAGLEDMGRYTRLFTEFFGQIFDELAVALRDSYEIKVLFAQNTRQEALAQF